jgi:hypothetical protein
MRRAEAMKWRGAGSGAQVEVDTVHRPAARVDATDEDRTTELLGRIAVLEDREHALNAELASLRADLVQLRIGLGSAEPLETAVSDGVEPQFEPVLGTPDAVSIPTFDSSLTSEAHTEGTELAESLIAVTHSQAAELRDSDVGEFAPCSIAPDLRSAGSDSAPAFNGETRDPTGVARLPDSPIASPLSPSVETSSNSEAPTDPPSPTQPPVAFTETDSSRIGLHSARRDFGGARIDDRAEVISGRQTSDIDALIQQAVGSRDRQQSPFERQQNEPPTAMATALDPATPQEESDPPTAESVPTTDDFFIRPDAPRKGRG